MHKCNVSGYTETDLKDDDLSKDAGKKKFKVALNNTLVLFKNKS